MRLKVLTTSVPHILPAETPVALLTNGCNVRVYNERKQVIAFELERVECRFHMDDDKTEIEIDGYAVTDASKPHWQNIYLTLG